MENKEPNGAYNKAPIFDRENYDYWKECMSFHIQLIDMDVSTANFRRSQRWRRHRQTLTD